MLTSPFVGVATVVQEEQMRGKAKWEHLNEDLHVLITVEDTRNRATIKLKHAVEQVKKLLIPSVSPSIPRLLVHSCKTDRLVTVASLQRSISIV